MLDGVEEPGGVVAAERRFEGDQLVEGQAKRVHVALRERLILEPLGRDEPQSADHVPAGDVLGVGLVGEP